MIQTKHNNFSEIATSDEMLHLFKELVTNKSVNMEIKIETYLDILGRLFENKKDFLKFQQVSHDTISPFDLSQYPNKEKEQKDLDEILSNFEKELNIKDIPISTKESNNSTLSKRRLSNGKRLSIIFQNVELQLKSVIDEKEKIKEKGDFNDIKENLKKIEKYFSENKNVDQIVKLVKNHKRFSIISLNKNQKQKKEEKSKLCLEKKTPKIINNFNDIISCGSPSGKKNENNYDFIKDDQISDFVKSINWEDFNNEQTNKRNFEFDELKIDEDFFKFILEEPKEKKVKSSLYKLN